MKAYTCFLFIFRGQILKYANDNQTQIPHSRYLKVCHFCSILRKTAFNFSPHWSYIHQESSVTPPSLRENIEGWVSLLTNLKKHTHKKKTLLFVEHFVPNGESEWSTCLIMCFHGVESSLKPRQLKWFTFKWKVAWLICNDTIYLVIMTFLGFGQQNKGWFIS